MSVATKKKVTYVHQESFARHLGVNISLHNWCKEKDTGDTPVSLNVYKEESSWSCGTKKKRVDEIIITNSKEYYRILFRSVLMVGEEIAFTKFCELTEG